MAYARMGDLSDFYIYKSLQRGFDCYAGKLDEESKYHHFETAKELLEFVELKISKGYRISPNSLDRIKQSANDEEIQGDYSEAKQGE